jgi:NAD(P)H-hydrate epimerase
MSGAANDQTPPVLSRRWVRELDRRALEEYGLLGLVLMENAGRGVADLLSSLSPPGPVAICCGRGNNGGDGFVIARHLEYRGWQVRTLLFCDPAALTGDAAANYQILAKSGGMIARCDDPFDANELSRYLDGVGWIVDALLGTGARGEPREPLGQVIDLINAHAAPRLAVDLPSGLDCDTGQAAQHTLRADHTATFAALKPGFAHPTATAYLGQVHHLEIGVPRRLMRAVLAEQENER